MTQQQWYYVIGLIIALIIAYRIKYGHFPLAKQQKKLPTPVARQRLAQPKAVVRDSRVDIVDNSEFC